MITLLLLAMAPSQFAFTILGEGSMTCGEWTDRHRSNHNRIHPEAAWVSGYVTAMAKSDSAHTRREIARNLEGAGIDHWTDNYCAAHPIDNIEAAAAALVGELKSRAR